MANKEETIIPPVTAEEFKDMAKPMSLDLTALFTLMRDDVIYIINKAGKEGWTIETLLEELESLI